MLSSFVRIGFLAALILTAVACTQPAAQVDLRGQNDYGRHPSTMASNAPAVGYTTGALSSTLQQPATVQSIGVSDLAAPTATAKPTQVVQPVAAAQPVQKTQPVVIKPTVVASDSVNQWTKKPHNTDAPVASAAEDSSDVASNELDNVISNDTAKKPAAAVAVTKPVKVAANTKSASFMWPVSSKKIISEFGPKGAGKANDGINIASTEGEPVWAAADGEVVYVGNELKGYGNMVLIKHGGDKATTYAHLSRAAVDKYDHVKQGDIIGYVGSTGSVKEPQLHFAIRDGKDAVDPLKYLDRKVASATP